MTDVKSEFETLGQNIKAAVQQAWDSEDRKKVQTEIENGMAEVGKALDKMVADFNTSETGQRVKREAEDFGERLRSGEVTEKAREELLNVLQKLNAFIEGALKKEAE